MNILDIIGLVPAYVQLWLLSGCLNFRGELLLLGDKMLRHGCTLTCCAAVLFLMLCLVVPTLRDA